MYKHYNYREDIKDLRITAKHAASCLEGVTYKETPNGCLVSKGKRSLDIYVDKKMKDQYPDEIKIQKKGKKFVLPIHRLNTALYSSIKDSIKKGLGM